MVGSALCYWIISEKRKVLYRTTVQNLTYEEKRYPNVQERIHDYHESLEDVLGSEEFDTSLYGYDSFINDNQEGIDKGYFNEEGYQGPPDSPDIDEILDNSDEERADNSYDQCIGPEVVLPDRKGEKLIGKVRKRVRYDDASKGEGNYNAMNDKYLYEVEYTDGSTEKLAANIISENILSRVDSEGNHYQVLTEVTDHKKDDSDIAKVDGFIKSIIGNLQQKRTTFSWKLLVE